MEFLHSVDPPVERVHTVTLSLSEQEMKYLAGLAELPIWYDQPTAARMLFRDLHRQLDVALADGDPETAGWTSHRDVGLVRIGEDGDEDEDF